MESKLTITLGVILMLTPALFAAEEEEKPDEILPAFSLHSSRNLDGETRKSWLTGMRNNLPMARRKVGPFGLMQDPAAVVAKAKTKKTKSQAFLNAIAAIKFTGVLPADKKFVIGAREFTAGEAFPIIRGNRQFNTKIVSVRGDHILFQNVDTGELVKRNLNTLPAGMMRGNRIDSVLGVIPDNKRDTTPLNLDRIGVGTAVPTSTRNR